MVFSIPSNLFPDSAIRFARKSPLERHRIRQRRIQLEAQCRKSFFCLLSCIDTIPTSILFLFSRRPSTFIGRHLYYINQIVDDAPINSIFRISLLEKERALCIKWFEIERKVRYQMKRVVSLWLYKRYKGRILNTEDPATLCAPIVPISVFDVRQRGMYRFELSSLKKQMEAELCYAEWLFPEPRHPKNPLTNLEFTEAQRISILRQFRFHNIGSWILEAYYSTEWDLIEFGSMYHIPLKLKALEYLVRNPSSDETIESVQDYILEEFKYHKLPTTTICVSMRILNWAVKNSYTTPYIQEWIKLFEEHTRASILFGDYEPTHEYTIKLRNFHIQSKLLFCEKIQYETIRAAYIQINRPPRLLQRQTPTIQFPIRNTSLGIPSQDSSPIDELDDSSATESEDTSLSIYVQDENRIIVELPDGTVRVIYSLPNAMYNLQIGNPSSVIEDGANPQV